VIKLLVGILKGAVIGGALGYGAFALGQSTGFDNPWIIYGLIGALVGLFVGRPIWSLIRDKNSTTVISILKSAFGFGIGCGLYAIVAKAWNPTLAISTIENVFAWPPTLGGAIGAIYGGFVELDDAVGDDKASKKDEPKKQLPAKKQ
jgi:Na+/proline symporter